MKTNRTLDNDALARIKGGDGELMSSDTTTTTTEAYKLKAYGLVAPRRDAQTIYYY